MSLQLGMDMSLSYNCSFIIILLFSMLLVPCLSLTSFLFGDSLLDAGNNDYLVTLSKADNPPYGIDFLLSGGQPTGRFTNGRTISDIVGQSLGGHSFPPPFLAPNSLDGLTKTHAGLNFASGSAGILAETGLLVIGRIPLQEQVNYFEQTRAHMTRMRGEKAANRCIKDAIFTIAIGSNDILNYIQPSIPFLEKTNVKPAIMQDLMISNLTMQLKRLRKLGASKVVVVGIGPLGCIPYVRAIKLLWLKECSTEVNDLVQGYNRKLKKELNLLNNDKGEDAIFVYANAYDIFMDLLTNYHQYGFENGKEPCCGGYFPPFVCFQMNDSHTNSSLCEDRSKYVFWDAYHPTEAANMMMAKKLVDGDQTNTSPINVRQLYSQNSSRAK